jgi:hypothetical protein
MPLAVTDVRPVTTSELNWRTEPWLIARQSRDRI